MQVGRDAKSRKIRDRWSGRLVSDRYWIKQPEVLQQVTRLLAA